MLGRRSFTKAIISIALMAITGQAMAETTWERIQSEDVVRIGFANEAPWSYAEADGTLAGADFELAKLVFSRLGISELEGVITRFGSLIPGLAAGRFDVIVAGLYIRPDRCEQVAFSEPTVAVGDALVVRAGNPKNITSYQSAIDDPSIILAGVVGAATANNALRAGVPEDQLVMFPDFPQAMAAVKAGRADAALQTAVTAQRTAEGDPAVERALPFEQPIIDGKPTVNHAGFAFRLEDQELLEKFNAELANVIGSPDHIEILEKYSISPEEIPQGVTTAELCQR